MSDIEGQLKDAAKRSGLSVNALALQSGLNYAIVHGFVKADRQITLRSAAKLARLLGLELRPARRERRR